MSIVKRTFQWTVKAFVCGSTFDYIINWLFAKIKNNDATPYAPCVKLVNNVPYFLPYFFPVT